MSSKTYEQQASMISSKDYRFGKHCATGHHESFWTHLWVYETRRHFLSHFLNTV
uniref:Uncharacterized protein n=1 Tax=Parascaris equorum TaxID=6256 RepID=A0A914SCC9_PAREQ